MANPRCTPRSGESSLERERERTGTHGLSGVEFTVLDALSRQHGWHIRMSQPARAAALSNSATTRPVNRLEDRELITRILCADDRRGIYTELTPAGVTLLAEARPTHDRVLEQAIRQAEEAPVATICRTPRYGVG